MRACVRACVRAGAGAWVGARACVRACVQTHLRFLGGGSYMAHIKVIVTVGNTTKSPFYLSFCWLYPCNTPQPPTPKAVLTILLKYGLCCDTLSTLVMITLTVDGHKCVLQVHGCTHVGQALTTGFYHRSSASAAPSVFTSESVSTITITTHLSKPPNYKLARTLPAPDNAGSKMGLDNSVHSCCCWR
jgi:hypothetical protein